MQVKLYLEMLACYPELEGVMKGLWKFRKQLKGVGALR